MTEARRRIAELRTLLARLDHVAATIQRVSQRLERAAKRAATGDEEAIAACALHLQHYYSAIEDALLALAREVDGMEPTGEDWHRALLDQMTLDVPGNRGPLLSPELFATLDVLRRFRHRVRHAYDEEYDWRKMTEPLAAFRAASRSLAGFFESAHTLIRGTIDGLERSAS